MKNKIIVGKIVNTIGLKGELRIVADRNNAERISGAKRIFVEGFDDSFVLDKIRVAGKNYAVKFAGFDKIEDVEIFKGKNLLLDMAVDFKLLEDEYYVDDLLQCNILIGDVVAKIVEIDNYGAGDIISFVYNGKEMQIPFVLDFFDKIDIKNKVLVASKRFFEGAVWR